MKTTSKLIVFGTVLLVLFGAAILLQPAFAGSLQQETAMPTTTKVSGTGLPAALAEVWAQFCVVTSQLSYVLVAIPEDATFEVVKPETDGTAVPSTQQATSTAQDTTATPEASATNTSAAEATATPVATLSTPAPDGTAIPEEVACNSLGTMDGKQIVLCRGPELMAITLNVTSGDETEALVIMPPACASNFATNTPTPMKETKTPTAPALPTDTPVPVSPTSPSPTATP